MSLTFLTCLRLVCTRGPRLVLRVTSAWIAGYAALRSLATVDADEHDWPPPLL